MSVFECRTKDAARERYELHVEAATEAGALTERGGGRSTGGLHVVGGHPWGSDHLAVVVEGTAWVVDNQTRRQLTGGQGAVWPAGAWFAVGSDSPCEVLRVGAKGLTVNRFLTASAQDDSWPAHSQRVSVQTETPRSTSHASAFVVQRQPRALLLVAVKGKGRPTAWTARGRQRRRVVVLLSQ